MTALVGRGKNYSRAGISKSLSAQFSGAGHSGALLGKPFDYPYPTALRSVAEPDTAGSAPPVDGKRSAHLGGADGAP